MFAPIAVAAVVVPMSLAGAGGQTCDGSNADGSSGDFTMSRVRVHNFSVSLDGFATGVGQSADAPFGHAGGRLLEWFFATRTFRAMHGERSEERRVGKECRSREAADD